MSLKNLFWKNPGDEENSQPIKPAVKANNKSVTPVSIDDEHTELMEQLTDKPQSKTTAHIKTEVVGDSSNEAESLSYFDKVFDERNFPGPDYHEFVKDALTNPDIIDMPEDKRFRTAFVGLKAAGVTIDKLVDTANKYIEMFAEKKAIYDAAAKTAWDERVEKLRAEAVQIEKQNEDIDKQIELLQKKKADNLESIKKLSYDADTEATNLTRKQKGFDSAYNKKVGEIKSNIQKINTYLK